jgi:hypothetical protein
MALQRKKINISRNYYSREPKSTERIFWTKHSKEKMKFYGLSENKLKRLLSNPERVEEGIAPKTVAIMQPAGTKKHPTEIWLMYQKAGKRIKIITAWRYPAVSPKGNEIPIPGDILDELKTIFYEN